MNQGIEATFKTDLSIPRSFRAGSNSFLETLKLRHAGSRLANGCFEVEMAHPSPLTVKMDSPDEDLVAKLTGGWQPGSLVATNMDRLFPLHILEALSSSPLRRLELDKIQQGRCSFSQEREAQRAALEAWFTRYKAFEPGSPTGRPALEALVRGVVAKNRGLTRQDSDFVTPDDVRVLVGTSIFEQFKKAGVVHF